MNNKTKSIVDRFFNKIKKSKGCWTWTGTYRGQGQTRYGCFKLNHKPKGTVCAHRYMYELTFGKIPKNKYVRRSCHNSMCVNPKHLMLGTHSDVSIETHKKIDLPPETRIWNKVDKTGKCWIWKGTKQVMISINGKGVLARRYIYLLKHGHINKQLLVHNTCRNSLCLNPKHLYQIGDKINELKCTACSIIKPISEFRKSPKKRTHISECSDCTSIRNRKKTYNLSHSKFTKMLKYQHNVCGICKKQNTLLKGKLTNSLCVDHDHKTGRVRGLLCSRCNKALGFFNDSIEELKSAIKYLEKASTKS